MKSIVDKWGMTDAVVSSSRSAEAGGRHTGPSDFLDQTHCEESVHIPLLFDAASPGLHFDFDLFLRFIFQPSPALLGGLAITI